MSKLEKVKKYYSTRLWNEVMVNNAVKKGWITEQEAAEVLSPEEKEETDE